MAEEVRNRRCNRKREQHHVRQQIAGRPPRKEREQHHREHSATATHPQRQIVRAHANVTGTTPLPEAPKAERQQHHDRAQPEERRLAHVLPLEELDAADGLFVDDLQHSSRIDIRQPQRGKVGRNHERHWHEVPERQPQATMPKPNQVGAEREQEERRAFLQECEAS